MDDRIQALEARIARIENALITRNILDAPVVVRTPAPAAQGVTEPVAAGPATATAPPRSAADTERFVGGRVLLAVGAIALLLGVSFFLKYAFDNGWIGPAGRVAIGLLAGAALLLASERLRSISQSVFAQGVTALGAGVLYLSLWAAGNGFHLVSLAVSFTGMVLVTGLLIVLALRRDSELTATWGLIGGLVTPLLNASTMPSTPTLLAYLVLLDAAIVFVRPRRAWKRIAPFALFFTQLYYFISIGGESHRALMHLSFATAFVVIFNLRPALKAFARAAFDASDIVIVVLSGAAYYGSLHWQLYDHHRLPLVAGIVVLAAAYVALAYRSDGTARALYAAFSLALVTGGIAVAFKGTTVPALWAIEGALLVWAGARAKIGIVQIFGAIAFAMGVIHMLIIPPEAGPLFANERFFTLVIFAAALATARYAGAAYSDPFYPKRAPFFRIAEVAAHVATIMAFSYELYAWSNHGQLALTVFWLLYGVALLAFGFVRNSIFTRIEALGLLALAVIKAFLVDMSEVDPAVRIVSFLVLGTVLLLASYLYLRSRQAATAEGK